MIFVLWIVCFCVIERKIKGTREGGYSYCGQIEIISKPHKQQNERTNDRISKESQRRTVSTV